MLLLCSTLKPRINPIPGHDSVESPGGNHDRVVRAELVGILVDVDRGTALDDREDVLMVVAVGWKRTAWPSRPERSAPHPVPCGGPTGPIPRGCQVERTELMELAKRMLAHVENGTTDQTDDLMEVPVSEYVDPDRWAAEMEVIFKRVPLALGLTCELREPGAYKAIGVLGVPVLISRGADGVVRSFLNVCRHRGAALKDAGCGAARRFTCPYHGWSYDQQGRLVGIYGEESYGPLERDTHGLTALPTAERGGRALSLQVAFDFVMEVSNAPLKVDLVPLHFPDVSGPLKGQGRQLQCRTSQRLALVGPDRAQK
jgi:nitrite reductase/ring-hydroxylating ferredoxin subunit